MSTVIGDAVTEDAGRDERRARLTRERVLEAAIELADREGIEAVSMRNLGQVLGIEAMSLYTHVRGKDDLLDGMADTIVGRVPLAGLTADWQPALRAQIMAARDELLRHRWAARVIETRTAPGVATIRYMDAVAGILRAGGYPVGLAHHALHALGSRVFGFNQDLFDDKGEADPGAAAAIAAELARSFPHVAEIALAASHEGGLGGCDDDVEFAFGLDLILDGLAVRRAEAVEG